MTDTGEHLPPPPHAPPRPWHTLSIEETGDILAAQQRFGADLVVMGTHGMNVVGQALLGSAASAVLRGAPCPVLVTTAGGCD